MTEFWPEILTQASWEKLQELKKEVDFILIGGWAVFLWTGLHKSKDIDIIVDFKNLDILKQNYNLGKNPNLKKYEIKLEKFDIDIYIEYFSEFVVPIKDIIKYSTSVEGFRIPEPEILLILKQSAEIERKDSVKGVKDKIDILALLIKYPFNSSKYLKFLKNYKIENYLHELTRIVREFDPKDSKHIGISFREFVKWRKGFMEEVKKIISKEN